MIQSPHLNKACLLHESGAAQAAEVANLKKQLTGCKCELRGISETRDQLDSQIQDLESNLDASNEEKTGLVKSKRIMELELKETKKKLMQKCGQLEELEGNFNSLTHHSSPERMTVFGPDAISDEIQGACAIPKPKEQGSADINIQLIKKQV